MRHFNSMAETFAVGTKVTTTVPTTAIVEGKPVLYTTKFDGALPIHDESKLGSFLDTVGGKHLDTVAKGMSATGYNAKGKPVFGKSEGKTTGAILASMLPSWIEPVTVPLDDTVVDGSLNGTGRNGRKGRKTASK